MLLYSVEGIQKIRGDHSLR